MKLESRMGVISSIVIFGILGGLSNAFADSLEWDQDLYMIEHGGILTMIFDNPQTSISSINATVSLDNGLNEIPVNLKKDSDTQFSSYFITFTTSGSGENQLLIPLDPNDPDPNTPPTGIIASVSIPVSASASSDVSQNNYPDLKDAWSQYKNKETFSVTDGICFISAWNLGGDTDGDGLCDKWEDTSLMGANPGLKVYLDDPNEFYFLSCDDTKDWSNNPLGDLVCPSPTKADFYIEIDSMEGHTPSQIALVQLAKSFKNSNYETITGVKGITAHIIADEKNLPHVDEVPNPGGGRSGSGTDALKRFWYGTYEERGDIAPPDTATWTGPIRDLKNYAFHYMIFAHDRAGAVGTSGYSEVQGNDVMITLGSWDGAVGSPDTQAGTMLHEIGHNLGLDHGGRDDDWNCKPNYISVMSFARQTSDLIDRKVQLSKLKINDLDETFVGPQAIGAYLGLPKEVVYSDSQGGIYTTFTSDDPWDFGTRTDLNYFPSFGCPDPLDSDYPGEDDQILESAWDYEEIDFVALGHANWKDGVSIPSTTGTSGDYDMGSTITRVQLEKTPIKTQEDDPEIPDNYRIIEREGKQYIIDQSGDPSSFMERPNGEIIIPDPDRGIPDEVCINIHSKEGRVANAALKRVCAGNELTFAQSLAMRNIQVGIMEKTIIGIPDGHFIEPREASSFKKEYLTQLEIIKDHINQNNMPSAIEETMTFQSWFDGEGEKEYIKNEISRDKVYSLTSEVIEAQLTVVPEFGSVVIVVLSISIISIIALTRSSKLRLVGIRQ